MNIGGDFGINQIYMNKYLLFFILCSIGMFAYAENNNLTLLCKGTLEYLEYPLKTNLEDATYRENATISYHIKNNLLLANDVTITSAPCKSSANSIYCTTRRDTDFVRFTSIDRISGKISDDASLPFNLDGVTRVRRHFDGTCVPAKKKF